MLADSWPAGAGGLLDLKRANNLKSEDVEAVRLRHLPDGIRYRGRRRFGPKDSPQTKEQADYNLKYLIAAALLDDQVGPAQLEPERVQAADAQALLKKVSVRPDAAFTAQYPHALNTRVDDPMQGRPRVFTKHMWASRAASTIP